MGTEIDRKLNWAREKLEPFGKLWARIVNRIETASMQQLRAYLKYCDKVGRTNCWQATK